MGEHLAAYANFVVGEKHTTTAKMEAKTNKGTKGIYIVKINCGSNGLITQKLIIE